MHQGFIVFTLHLSHSPPASFFPDSIYGRFLVLFDPVFQTLHKAY